MTENQKKRTFRLGLGFYLNLGLAVVFSIAAVFLVSQISKYEREQALREAENKAKLILDRNLATHTYFSHSLKPSLFELTKPVRSESYFEPTWMSSTYAVREIEKNFKALDNDEYYYKECAINARSPENEADAFEKAFIEELNRNPELILRSMVRNLDGQYYFVTLRRGEVLEESCLRCHSTPDKAPQGLIDLYGPERSFHRNVNDVISAISIRVPLSTAYAKAEQFSRRLSTIFVFVLIALFSVQYLIYRLFVLGPVTDLKDRALRISNNDELLGKEIPLPLCREFEELASAFNTMSQKIRYQMDNLENMVEERTAQLTEANGQLQNALNEIRTLQGILPVCSYCKNIRDDKGYWNKIEAYICNHTNAEFSHSICPDCLEKYHPQQHRILAGKNKIPEEPADSEKNR